MKTVTQKISLTLCVAAIIFVAFFPQFSHAQITTDSIQGYIWAFGYFINARVIPFLFAIALLVFIYNIARYFIVGGDNEESRGKAKQLAIYAIIGFVFLVSIWGIVNAFVWGLGFGRETPVTPDYIERNYAPIDQYGSGVDPRVFGPQ